MPVVIHVSTRHTATAPGARDSARCDSARCRYTVVTRVANWLRTSPRRTARSHGDIAPRYRRIPTDQSVGRPVRPLPGSLGPYGASSGGLDEGPHPDGSLASLRR